MIRTPTVFVIGAGASRELGFPVGETLKEGIGQAINFEFDTWGEQVERGNRAIWEAIKVHARTTNNTLQAYVDAAHRLCAALPLSPSIDNCLFNHSSDPLAVACGKAAISTLILEHEQNSSLVASRRKPIDFSSSSLKHVYLRPLTTLLGTDMNGPSPAMFENVSFVIFNYDRCVEQFLYNALQSLFSIPPDQAAELLRPVKFLHPYGSLGPLPWQEASADDRVEFGHKGSAVLLNRMAQNIRTFTEQNDDEDFLDELRATYLRAQRAVYLGFGFLNQNLELLTSANPSDDVFTRHTYATGIGISEPDVPIIERKVQRSFASKMYPSAQLALFRDKTCCQLINELWHTLQA